MPLLLPVLLRTACPSTHHKLAIDALRFLRGDSADDWRDLLLRFHKPLLAGAKAPDDELKDFQNHVLYVGNQPWGGSASAACEKFDQLTAALSERRWGDAALAAGMLSHYVSEPFMPLNTRQSEGGNLVQPGIEWCVNRSYGQLQSILEEDFGGYPAVELEGDGLEPLIRRGAKMAAKHYDTLVEHFDLGRALIDPDEALDQELLDCLAVCLGSAVVSFARVLELAIEKSGVSPPRQEVSPSGLIASLKAPFRVLSCHTYEQVALRQLEAMHEELELSGRVSESLPAEQREIRRLYAEEVLRVPAEQLAGAEPAACGAKYGQGPTPRYRLNKLHCGPAAVRTGSRASQLAGLMSGRQPGDNPAVLKFTPPGSRHSPIEELPVLTARQAARLRQAAIDTIGDLIAADPQFLAERLRLRRDEAHIVNKWQAAARERCGPSQTADAARTRVRRAA